MSDRSDGKQYTAEQYSGRQAALDTPDKVSKPSKAKIASGSAKGVIRALNRARYFESGFVVRPQPDPGVSKCSSQSQAHKGQTGRACRIDNKAGSINCWHGSH